MKSLISEFSYGYALTEELTNGSHGGLTGAPIFPTQNQEGVIGGYDIHIPYTGIPIFLQFKLSEYLSRRSAKEWTDFGGPYYRMQIRPTRFSDQQRLLVEWEALGNETFYVTPEFHRQSELNTFYLGNAIVDNSAFFSPSDIGLLPDEKDHYVVFARNNPIGWFHSSETRKTKKRFQKGEFEEYFISIVRERPKELSLEFFQAGNEHFIGFLEARGKEIDSIRRFERAQSISDKRTRNDAALLLSYLTRTYLDAELVIITAPEAQQGAAASP